MQYWWLMVMVSALLASGLAFCPHYSPKLKALDRNNQIKAMDSNDFAMNPGKGEI
jgi:hypothetical protein